MKRIGILSDTHGYWDDRYLMHFFDCDEIWHAGDIGSPLIIDRLAGHCPVRVVRGNIDGHELRQRFDEVLCFRVEECNVMMTHIGGYPGKYSPAIRGRLYSERPDIFVAGHSHILKVMYDNTLDCLHVNPGAAGKQGWQAVRTLVKLTIDGMDVRDLEVIELS